MHNAQRHSDMCAWLATHHRWDVARHTVTLALANLREARDVATTSEWLASVHAYDDALTERNAANTALNDLTVKINNWDRSHDRLSGESLSDTPLSGGWA